MNKKIILLTPSNLGPYHFARYTVLAKGEIEFVLVKMPIKEHYRPWESANFSDHDMVKTPFLPGKNPVKQAFFFLKSEQPDAVICVGYNSKYIWAMSLGCKLLKIPCILYSVGWHNSKRGWKFKEFAKHYYVKNFFNGAIVTGERAAEYSERLGISKSKIFKVGNVVDNSHFAKPYKFVTDDLPRDYFLTVSRLSPEKNIDGLLKAYEIYYQNGGKWHLCIAGTGPIKDNLIKSIPPSIKGRIHWLGWVRYKDLPGIYQKSRCLILPSTYELWGLVVNEAMATGKPVLVSKMCGCQPELCHEGINGFSFDPEEHNYLASLMDRMENMDQTKLNSFGEASRKVITNYSLETWRNKFISAVLSIVE